MGWLRLSLAVSLSTPIWLGPAAAIAAQPELVTVPMATDGTTAAEGLEAWKIVKDAVMQSRQRLGVSVELQKSRHDFLVGPAREQVKDCGDSPDCLKEIGAALGADILVTGTVTRSAVVLLAVEVATGRLVGDAATPIELAKAPLSSRASAAARLLVAAMAGDPDPTFEAGGPSSGVPTGGPMAVSPGGDDELKGFDNEPAATNPALAGGPSAPVSSSDPNGDRSGSPYGSTEPASEAPLPSSVMQGRLKISRDQLAGVSRVSIDGGDISFSGDGSIEWTGQPGDHTLVAEKASGARLSRNVFLEPGSVTNVVLEFPQLAPPPPLASARDDDDSVLTTWWFWTSIGAAVAAGTTTAVILAGGDKGGPSLPNETGTIRGTY